MRFFRLLAALFGLLLVLLSGMQGSLRRAESSIIRLAFAAAPDGEYATQIYTMWADGRQRRQLTALPYSAWMPAWSPDSRKIAFFHFNDVFERGLYLMDANGRNLINPAMSLGGYSAPHWSPDGAWIAYESYTALPGTSAESRMNIYRLSRDGGQIEPVLEGRNFWRYALSPQLPGVWSPDGAQMVVIGYDGTELDGTVFRVEDGQPIPLASNPGAAVYVQNAVWSPDGAWIAYISDLAVPHDVVLIAPDGSQQHQLATPDIDEEAVAWSPDSQQLLTLSTDHRLHILPVNGGAPRLLTEVAAYETAGWSPDGAWIVFTGNLDSLLYRIRPDGTDLQTLTQTPACCANWSKPVDLPFAAARLLLMGSACLFINAPGIVHFFHPERRKLRFQR